MTLLHPAYDEKRNFYWFVWVLVVGYVAGILLYVGVFVQNNSMTHTWFANPGLPGSELTSFRGTFTDVAIRLSIIAHILCVAIIICMVIYRGNYACSSMWFILYIVTFLMTLIGFGALLASYVHCNGQNEHGNPCNDRKYCCVPEIYANPINRCPNTLPCDPPVLVEELCPNADFLGLFWVNTLLMLFFQVGFIVMAIMNNRRDGEYEEEEDEVTPDASLPAKEEELKMPVLLTSKRIHGLRQRK